MNEQHRNRLKVQAIRLTESISHARECVAELTYTEFIRDEKAQYAVRRALDVMSRSAFYVLRQHSDALGRSPWIELSSIWRRVSPNYNESEPEILWRTVVNDLPIFEDEVRRKLREAEILDLPDRGSNHPSDRSSFVLRYKYGAQLSPTFLKAEITPYLIAVAELQRLIDQIEQRPDIPVTIRRISQQSPITVTLEGAAEALKTMDEIIVPARRKHRSEMDRLDEATSQVEIEKKKAEIAQIRAGTAAERAEAKKKRLEVERLKLENERLQFEIEKMKIDTVLELLDRIAPTLPESERIGYAIRLLKPTSTLLLSDLEIEQG